MSCQKHIWEPARLTGDLPPAGEVCRAQRGLVPSEGSLFQRGTNALLRGTEAREEAQQVQLWSEHVAMSLPFCLVFGFFKTEFRCIAMAFLELAL